MSEMHNTLIKANLQPRIRVNTRRLRPIQPDEPYPMIHPSGGRVFVRDVQHDALLVQQQQLADVANESFCASHLPPPRVGEDLRDPCYLLTLPRHRHYRCNLRGLPRPLGLEHPD
jgi:hypothetical protein